MSQTDHVLAPMVRKLTRWSGLSPADQQAILNLPYSMRRIGRGNYIVREGDRPTHSCLLVSGFAFRTKVVGDGGRQIVAVHLAGDLVDLQNALLETSDHNVQALTDAHIAEISADAIKSLIAERPAVAAAMWYDTLVDGSLHREWTTNIGRRNARSRLSHLFCEMAVRSQDAGLGTLSRYQLPMTQEELADAVGPTAVHVNRSLMSLKREGLLERRLKTVSINDWDGLVEAADFSPQYLHVQDERQEVC